MSVQRVTEWIDPPKCERDDCSLAHGPSSTTLLGFTQLFDKQGRRINADPNVTTSMIHCQTCGKDWAKKVYWRPK